MKIEANETRIIQYPNRIFKIDYRINTNGEIFSPFLNGAKMSTHINRDGYENIYLYLANGDRKCFKVHRLIMNTFCPIENSEEMQVNHINGIKSDNRLENLEWCTRSENLIHAFKTGLEAMPKGEKNGNHKLTDKQVIKIYKKVTEDHIDPYWVSKEYNVSESTIRSIKNKRTWKHILENL